MKHAASAWTLLVALGCSLTLAAESDSPEPTAISPTAISSSREMLKLLGVADRLTATNDGVDFTPEGDELLWRLLAAVGRFSLVDIDRWKQTDVAPETFESDPARYRGSLVAWTGTVTRVVEHELPAETAERFNLPRYYRCEMAIAKSDARVIVYALAVPQEWLSAEAIHERASVSGLFVRVADEQPESAPRPVIVARRVAWHPPTLLGDLDMDVGLFDELSPRPDLAAEDRECFYQLLAAVGRAGTRQLSRGVPQAGRNASVVPLFNRPNEQRGRLVELTGTARQAVLRRVEDPDIVARFGIDHYYEMEIFTDDSQGNPLTFCVRELPKGFPQGDKITEPVRVAGFFFKRWGYRISATDGAGGAAAKHLAPLLIGREPVRLEAPEVDQRFANGVFLVLFVLLTGVLWLVVSRLSHGDAKFQKQLERRFLGSPRESLSNIGLNAENGSAVDGPARTADSTVAGENGDDNDSSRA